MKKLITVFLVLILVLSITACGKKEEPVKEEPVKKEEPAKEEVSKEKPAEEKPAEEKPAEEKPAEKPAEEKPAEEQKPLPGATTLGKFQFVIPENWEVLETPNLKDGIHYRNTDNKNANIMVTVGDNIESAHEGSLAEAILAGYENQGWVPVADKIESFKLPYGANVFSKEFTFKKNDLDFHGKVSVLFAKGEQLVLSVYEYNKLSADTLETFINLTNSVKITQ